MSSFTDELVVTPMPDGRKWKLVKEFDYHVGSENSNWVVHVPKGFVTDFASVPWGLWNIFPSWGKYGKATIIHDYLYQSKETSRLIADTIFKEAMLVLKVPMWKVNLMYWGVRTFAWIGYSKNNLPVGGING
jgi:hypothetical protein